MYFDIHTHQSTCHNVTCVQNIIIEEGTTINIKKNQFYSAGIHPWYLPVNDEKSLSILERIISNKQILVLGEIGLDFHQNIIQKHSKEQQIDIFIKQITIAETVQKPIIIHCVKAWDTLLDLKKNYGKNIPWIVHGFSKNKMLATQLIDAGFYLSFGANIFKSTVNTEALQYVPLDKIFLETDAQTDYNIQDVYKKASELLNISENNLAKILKNNCKKNIHLNL